MRRRGLKATLPLVLAVCLLAIPLNTTTAGPAGSWIDLTTVQEDLIEFSYGWDKIWVSSYSVYVVESTSRYYFYHADLGERTRGHSDSVSVSHTGIDAGDQNIYVRLWLYDKNGRMIKHARLDIRLDVPA